MTGPANTWAQPYSRMLLAEEEVSFDKSFELFRGMYFDTKKKTKAEKAICQLEQTKTVSAYTHQFAAHFTDTGWEVSTLISQDIRAGIIYARATFKTREEVANFTLKIDNEFGGTHDMSTLVAPAASQSNTMDLSVMHGQLLEAEKTGMMRAGLCF
ncbi:hypothetical protein Pst134EA_005312 [Puccinia striiformis f. sp. tritici]|uniref:hypothetical protein n=1 Tax=Puccinia striiformis f. sp. tritici TaxID=168172 RepID=UPI00200817F6|nr:hypothetical protein Pst134EA_005312 [Puccinia striiformis f. sp. tritici]KAH9471412.1 hypothetical protein Pst134EA_005312 [Puccinia striiformis f. sp. tritici]